MRAGDAQPCRWPLLAHAQSALVQGWAMPRCACCAATCAGRALGSARRPDAALASAAATSTSVLCWLLRCPLRGQAPAPLASGPCPEQAAGCAGSQACCSSAGAPWVLRCLRSCLDRCKGPHPCMRFAGEQTAVKRAAQIRALPPPLQESTCNCITNEPGIWRVTFCGITSGPPIRWERNILLLR